MKHLGKKLAALTAGVLCAVALAAPLQANATIDLLDVNGKEVSGVMDVEIRQNRYGYSYAIDLPAKDRKVTVTFKPAADSDITVYTMKSEGDDLSQNFAAQEVSVKAGSTYTVTFEQLKDDVAMVDFTSAVKGAKYTISAAEGSAPAKDTLIKPVAGVLYRLYNPNTGEHFYTAGKGERDHLISVGWVYEDTAWTAPADGDPVYRLYNVNAGEHFYTKKANEKDHLVSLGWKYEGIGWNSESDKGVPVYREYNPNAKTGTHNYTTSKAEHDHLVSIGWKDEDIAWYGVAD